MSSDSDGWLARDLKLVTRAVESRHQAISRADEANADFERRSKVEHQVTNQTASIATAPPTHIKSVIEGVLCHKPSAPTPLPAPRGNAGTLVQLLTYRLLHGTGTIVAYEFS